MLHIISSTPINQAILERTAIGDNIILIEDAVIGAVATTAYSQDWKSILQYRKVFALAADLVVRGLDADKIVKGIEIVDYPGFVQLTVDNEVIHSWH